MLTRTGALVAGSAAALLLAGWAADYPELVALGLAAVAALVLAAGWLRVRPDLTVTRTLVPDRVAEGGATRGVLTVTNNGRRRSPALEATEPVARLVAGQRLTVEVPALARGASYRVTYPVPVARRGRYTVEPLVVGHCDPLRLLRVGRRYGKPAVLYVHPRVHPLDPSGGVGVQDQDGRTVGLSLRDGTAFHSLRAYEPADDWRLIHWKSTARTGTLMVRHTVVSDEPRHLVVLDTRAAGYDDVSFEDAVRVAASLCAAAARAGYPVTLRTTGGRVAVAPPPGHGGGSAVAALDLLADVRRAPDDPGLPALSRLLAESTGVVLAVVTGHPERGQLAVLPAVRPAFVSVDLIQVGTAGTGRHARLPGVGAVDVPTSDVLPAAWNELVRR